MLSCPAPLDTNHQPGDQELALFPGLRPFRSFCNQWDQAAHLREKVFLCSNQGSGDPLSIV